MSSEAKRCNALIFVETCKLIRIIQPSGTPTDVEIPDIEDLFTPKIIVPWEEFDNYPDVEESEINGIILDDSQRKVLLYEADYPLGIQFVEYPNCPICNQIMNSFIFQLESDDNLDYMWGDTGIGYIVKCPEHKEQVVFFW